MDIRNADKIIIENLEVFAYHGVFGFEKKKGQTFYISAVIYTDTQKPGLSDNLNDTVSYADICEEIQKFNEENAFDLIETAAEKIAVYLLNGHEKISAIDLMILMQDFIRDIFSNLPKDIPMPKKNLKKQFQ